MDTAAKQEGISIRTAQVSDAEELLEIYAPYVENTAISFEYEVPSLSEFRQRIGNIQKKYPYFVAQKHGKIIGYAYASDFHPRKAFQWSVETTIYLREECRGRGVGRMLYHALEETLRLQNILTMDACIAYTEMEDEYLTNASQRFHESMGYQLIGRFKKAGNKFGKWYDIIWMEKKIGLKDGRPSSVRTFPQIRSELSF